MVPYVINDTWIFPIRKKILSELLIGFTQSVGLINRRGTENAEKKDTEKRL